MHRTCRVIPKLFLKRNTCITAGYDRYPTRQIYLFDHIRAVEAALKPDPMDCCKIDMVLAV